MPVSLLEKKAERSIRMPRIVKRIPSGASFKQGVPR
jgi:hypothetical protein